VREADNLPPYSADVKKSRSLNSPRPLWACMACNGCALPYKAFSIEHDTQNFFRIYDDKVALKNINFKTHVKQA
jgi:hypothetical protein